eukprot:CAMPEP_0116886504 /NCGR_PEP_ID=MMETSP0463-20121206/20387_1 /TAXON_ID=181622 /ORGANISM="Strombidinopsis sp, Strain SopsisLIS2011" /LENGTH=46 /DNA_ID= /DNA_START= /DNA_END= /DNA_ORIENTATION=
MTERTDITNPFNASENLIELGFYLLGPMDMKFPIDDSLGMVFAYQK